MKQELDAFSALAYVLAAISGASGGCLVVAHKVLKGRSLTTLAVMSYGVVGAVLSMTMLAFMYVVKSDVTSFSEVILWSVTVGFVGALALGATNITTRLILKHLGITVEIHVKDNNTVEKDK